LRSPEELLPRETTEWVSQAAIFKVRFPQQQVPERKTSCSKAKATANNIEEARQ
jgi:hypothetical protein